MKIFGLTAAAVALVPTLLAAQVSYDRLRNAESEPHNWLTYSGNFSAHRYSALRRDYS